MTRPGGAGPGPYDEQSGKKAGDDGPASRLERRYRAWLRLLPSWYRERWEEDMVSAFHASTRTGDPDENDYLDDFGRPNLAERASIVGLAVRLRLGGPEAPPRAQLWGGALRRFALVGLLVLAVDWAHGAASMLVFDRHLGSLVEAVESWDLALWLPGGWELATLLSGSLWAVALVALLTGRWRTAKFAALGGLLWTAGRGAYVVFAAGTGTSLWRALMVAHLLVVAGVVLALIAYHPGSPRPRAWPWLLAFIAAGVGGPVLMIGSSRWVAIDWMPAILQVPMTWTTVWMVAVVWHLVGARVRRLAHAPEWTLALALLTVPVGLERAPWLLLVVENAAPLGSSHFVAEIARTAAVAILGSWVALRAAKELRRRAKPAAARRHGAI